VEEAERLYAELDYPRANQAAQQALKERSLSHEQLVRGYRVLGLSSAAMNEPKSARDAFVMLLMLDPEFEIDPKVSPRIRTALFEARGYWRAQPSRPGVETSAAATLDGGSIRVVVRDPLRVVGHIAVAYRWGADGDFISATLEPGEHVEVKLSRPPEGATRLDYYAQALDANDGALFESGRPEQPLTTRVSTAIAGPTRSEGNSRSVLASPWFWGFAAVGVIAAGTVTFFAVRGAGGGEPKVSVRPQLQCGPTLEPCR
jgi:hypothetical protein